MAPAVRIPRWPDVHGKRTLWKGRCVVHDFALPVKPMAVQLAGHTGGGSHTTRQGNSLLGAASWQGQCRLGTGPRSASPDRVSGLYIAPPVFFNRR